MADDLHDFGIGTRAHVLDRLGARFAIVAGEFHLDQLVMVERTVELLEQCRCDALLTDHDDRTQRVRQCAQMVFLMR